MINHPNRSKTHRYIVTAYRLGRNNAPLEVAHQVVAASADDAVRAVAGGSKFASVTRRWQNSPNGSDRDNYHAQANAAGTVGWAARRASVVPEEAARRNAQAAPGHATDATSAVGHKIEQ